MSHITLTSTITSVAGKTGVVSLVKGDVGLGNVDNTADASKPVSTAQAAAIVLAGPLTTVPARSADYTATAGQLVPMATTSGGRTVTLPSAPADKTRIGVKHIAQSGTNVVTIAAAGSDVFNKVAGSTTLTLSQLNQMMVVQYDATAGIWYVQDSPSLAVLDATYAKPRSSTDRVWYVSTQGSDSNDGLSPGAPLLTLAAAVAKLPATSQTFNNTRRANIIEIAPGDYTLSSAVVINHAANVEIRSSGGGRGQAATPAYGGVNIFTPVGSVGLTIGYYGDNTTTWSSAKGGCVVRGLHFAPSGTDTGSSVGLKVVGFSNCLFENVTVSDYVGTGSVGHLAQGSPIANGGSGGSTMYNDYISCGFNRSTVGVQADGSCLNLIGGVLDGNNDIITSYLAGSTAILLTNGSRLSAYSPKIQGYEIGIDDSQAHGAGVLYALQLFDPRFEACKTGIISNQLGTVIHGGSYYSGGLTAGTTGTTAVKMLSGAEFDIAGMAISGVETPYNIDSAAVGFWRDSDRGAFYQGAVLRVGGAGTYVGTVPTGAIQAPAGTGATFGSFATGSTAMSGQFTFTTGTTLSAGNVVRITFPTAFPTGTIPIVLVNKTTSGSIIINAASVTNSTFDVASQVALAASTTYTVQYAIVGTHT